MQKALGTFCFHKITLTLLFPRAKWHDDSQWNPYNSLWEV